MQHIQRLLSIVILLTIITATHAQEIGVQLYSFRKQLPQDVPGMLKRIHEMGIRELEGGDSYGLPIDQFKQLLADNRLKVVSVSADFKELDSNVQAVVQRAKTYGAKYAVCFWIPHQEGGFTVEEMNRGIEVFNRAGKILQENGISLCYHPHGYEFRPYEGGTMFDHMVKQLDPRNVNFEMDVFWIKHPGQDPVALLNKYPGRFKLMHLKDRRPGTEGNQNGRADVESNVVLGQGDVGIASIMKLARKAGVQHFFIEDESSRSLEQVPQSLAYLKSLK